jgi:alkylhydroperoxidase family enzyme
MARIPLLDENDPVIPQSARQALIEAGQSRGRLLNIYRAMANRPEALRAFIEMVSTVYRAKSTLPPKHGELAYLTATAVNDCYY